MGSLLVHITHGPEAPTRAALGVHVAKAAVEKGHDVSVFFAGDGVYLLKDEVVGSMAGLGTGVLSDLMAVLLDSDATIYASGMSAKTRGVTADAEAKGATLAAPPELVDLVFAADRVMVY